VSSWDVSRLGAQNTSRGLRLRCRLRWRINNVSFARNAFPTGRPHPRKSAAACTTRSARMPCAARRCLRSRTFIVAVTRSCSPCPSSRDCHPSSHIEPSPRDSVARCAIPRERTWALRKSSFCNVSDLRRHGLKKRLRRSMRVARPLCADGPTMKQRRWHRHPTGVLRLQGRGEARDVGHNRINAASREPR
jgi:hypothetical protein